MYIRLSKKCSMNRRGGLVCKITIIAQVEPLCAIQFMILVEVDSHVHPKVALCAIPTASRYQIIGTVNEMDEWIVCADTTRSGGHISLPLPVRVRCINTQYRASNRQMVCVIIWRRRFCTMLRQLTYWINRRFYLV